MDDIKILCIEDEAVHLDKLEMLIDKLGYQLAGTATNALDATELFYETQPDIILMDIHLDGELDGIQLAERLLQKKRVPLIFVTAFNDDATFQRAQQLQPFAFIIKPFGEQQLSRTIELAVSALSKTEEKPDFQKGVLASDKLFFKINNKLKRVEISTVLYVEADGRYSSIMTDEGRKYVLRISMTELLNRLPAEKFMRIHRSYFVQIEKIREVDLSDNMLQVGNHSIPISRRNKDLILERLPWLS